MNNELSLPRKVISLIKNTNCEYRTVFGNCKLNNNESCVTSLHYYFYNTSKPVYVTGVCFNSNFESYKCKKLIEIYKNLLD